MCRDAKFLCLRQQNVRAQRRKVQRQRRMFSDTKCEVDYASHKMADRWSPDNESLQTETQRFVLRVKVPEPREKESSHAEKQSICDSHVTTKY